MLPSQPKNVLLKGVKVAGTHRAELPQGRRRRSAPGETRPCGGSQRGGHRGRTRLEEPFKILSMIRPYGGAAAASRLPIGEAQSFQAPAPRWVGLTPAGKIRVCRPGCGASQSTSYAFYNHRSRLHLPAETLRPNTVAWTPPPVLRVRPELSPIPVLPLPGAGLLIEIWELPPLI